MSTGAGEMARGKVGTRMRGRGKEGSGAVMVVVVGGGVHSHKATDAVVVVIGWSSGTDSIASPSPAHIEPANHTSDAAAGATETGTRHCGAASASPGDNKGSSPTDGHHGGQHRITPEGHHERRTAARPITRRRRRARLQRLHHPARAHAPDLCRDRRARAEALRDPEAMRPLRPDRWDGHGRADRDHAGPAAAGPRDVQGGASKLEEAIRECVREHTVFQSEGNDGDPFDDVQSPISYPLGRGDSGRSDGVKRHQSNASMMSFSARGPRSSYGGDRRWSTAARYGDANALLYDMRENRTKTAVTAVYQNTPKGAPPALLRSYDSRKEPAPEFNCTIWQAGRATSATGLAFKPIQIGQSVFIDESHGRFNPSPVALDEVTLNEYPGRPVGTFVSIGTGKRPSNTDATSHLWYDDFLGDFAEARRRLIAKIEGCETTHLSMPSLLAARNVEIDAYIRLNVEVGVGDFGMNEWARLADISTSTRRYLARPDVQAMSLNAATRLARIYLTRLRGR
ncbi:hypothetical protein V496_06309, partial [Pseudogymnoascus sp. VKM F-4515 (FW-2607)]